VRGSTLLLSSAIALVVSVAGASAGAGGSSWGADYETGDLSQWLAFQARDASRVTIETSVVRQGHYAARFEVHPGDNNVASSGAGERAEVFTGVRATDGI
jgi:hypothetical protein